MLGSGIKHGTILVFGLRNSLLVGGLALQFRLPATKQHSQLGGSQILQVGLELLRAPETLNPIVVAIVTESGKVGGRCLGALQKIFHCKLCKARKAKAKANKHQQQRHVQKAGNKQ